MAIRKKQTAVRFSAEAQRSLGLLVGNTGLSQAGDGDGCQGPGKKPWVSRMLGASQTARLTDLPNLRNSLAEIPHNCTPTPPMSVTTAGARAANTGTMGQQSSIDTTGKTRLCRREWWTGRGLGRAPMRHARAYSKGAARTDKGEGMARPTG